MTGIDLDVDALGFRVLHEVPPVVARRTVAPRTGAVKGDVDAASGAPHRRSISHACGVARPMLRVRLCENMRALGYAPFYFALVGEHFASAGVEIELITSPSASRTGAMLLDGAADVSWGGPMRVMMHHQADPTCTLVCFAQIVARDPFVLVGRAPNPRFRFQDLRGLRVAVATEVPTPWLMFQDDLARAGIDPASLRRTHDQPMDAGAAALLAGEADVVQVFEPYVDQLTVAGCHVWHRFSTRGDIAYTTFYATRDFATGQREACRGWCAVWRLPSVPSTGPAPRTLLDQSSRFFRRLIWRR